jgi:16S rRNA (adenine1518-N6/adenine1519-N6)-dimethyltransferase
VLLQEDFVEKITAPPGARNYRGISALTQISFDVNILDKVGAKSFSPSPKVSSAMVSFVPRLRIPRAEASEIMRLFSLRRRQIDSALAELGMRGGGGHGKRRVYSLGPEEVHELCRQ